MTCLVAVAGSVPLGADLLKPPTMTRPDEQGATTIRTKNGTVRAKTHWTMQHALDNGHDAVKMTETGEGMYGSFNQQVRWNIDCWWTSGESFRPLHFEKTVTDLSGKVLLRERKQFDWTRNEAHFEHEELNKPKKTRVIPVPPDTLTIEGIAGALRSLPFGSDFKFPAHILTNEPKVYPITLELRGRETIRTSSGNTMECYKVELVPHVGGGLDAFHFLFPKVYFWMNVAAPHLWVRYQGPENGPGTPDIVMD
jgi:hypothetical protein